MVLPQTRMEMREQEFFANFFCLTLGQLCGKLEAMNVALVQLLSRIGSSKKAVTFSDPTAAVH
jgi:hypothetical protein